MCVTLSHRLILYFFADYICVSTLIYLLSHRFLSFFKRMFSYYIQKAPTIEMQTHYFEPVVAPPLGEITTYTRIVHMSDKFAYLEVELYCGEKGGTLPTLCSKGESTVLITYSKHQKKVTARSTPAVVAVAGASTAKL